MSEESIVVKLVRSENLVLRRKIDLLNGLSFLISKSLQTHAPELPRELRPYLAKITGED